MSNTFWSGKKVLVTGHTGFKGSWLSLWLQELGANVTGYALLPPTNPNLFDVASITNGMTSIVGDIRDYNRLKDIIIKYRPEIVFHLAAQPLVRYSYQYPVETYTTNVLGTVHLLEAIRATSATKVVVNITTDKCYENNEWLWGYRENEPLGGYDPYSSSKACSELVTNAYKNSFFNANSYHEHGIAIATARAGNVIGGGDWAHDRIIPDILHAFSHGQNLVIRNPRAIRPWQHVLDPLHGYITLAENLWTSGPPYAEAWNFGPLDKDAQPVEWIVKKLASLWDSNVSWSIDKNANPHEAMYLKLDCSKAHLRLNWYPRLALQHALEKVVAWHKAYLRGENMHEITLQQINSYTNYCNDI